MVIKSIEARCLNCHTGVKREQDRCSKCGDPVRIGLPILQVEEEMHAPPEARGVAFLDGDQATVLGNAELMAETARELERRAGLQDISTPAEQLQAAAHTPPAVELTGEQEQAIEKARDWYAASGVAGRGHVFRLFGPAGTGKTTIARHIAAALNVNAVFGAYTGKAAHVLRKKGVPANTIHSSIYMLDPQMELRARRHQAMRELGECRYVNESGDGLAVDDETIQALETEIAEIEAKLRRPAFSLNEASEWGYADLIVLDEVSMVNDRMAADIESFGVPVLVLGDPAQLPPIEGGGHYTSAEPDFLLTEVHRQALESPVLKLATDIRTGQGWMEALEPVDMAEAMRADQVLCWKNSTRWNLINQMRVKLGRPAGAPVPGDRIMCLVNNKDLGVLNGQQFEVLKATLDKAGFWDLQVRDDDGREREVAARAGGFRNYDEEQAEKRAGAWRGETGLFTFANAITVHRAQGSEWDHVYVVDQTHQMTRETESMKRRWMYTAATRARYKVTLASTLVK